MSATNAQAESKSRPTLARQVNAARKCGLLSVPSKRQRLQLKLQRTVKSYLKPKPSTEVVNEPPADAIDVSGSGQTSEQSVPNSGQTTTTSQPPSTPDPAAAQSPPDDPTAAEGDIPLDDDDDVLFGLLVGKRTRTLPFWWKVRLYVPMEYTRADEWGGAAGVSRPRSNGHSEVKTSESGVVLGKQSTDSFGLLVIAQR